MRCDKAGWQLGFVHHLALVEACRLLKEVQAWLPQPLVADGGACSRVLAQSRNPAQEFEEWTSRGRSAPTPPKL